MGKQKAGRGKRDHFVSAGWQKNFARRETGKGGNEKHKVCHFSVTTGEIIDRDRNVESSLLARDYGTFWNPDGSRNRTVDELFSKTEDSVLRPLRSLSRRNVGEAEKNRIIQLFAVHHARSVAMRSTLRAMVDDFAIRAPDELLANSKVGRYWLLTKGRLPDRDEIAGYVEEFRREDDERKTTEVKHLPGIRDDAVRFLSKLNVQVVESPPSYPGFVLGDVPVVNALLSEQRFGIRDGIKFDASDFIGGPLTRHQAVAFSHEHGEHFEITNPELIARFNVQTLLAATHIVVCHPQDAEATKFLWDNRDAYRSTAPLVH